MSWVFYQAGFRALLTAAGEKEVGADGLQQMRSLESPWAPKSNLAGLPI
jgi:hypothetical protein